jgi:hypothetical protein
MTWVYLDDHWDEHPKFHDVFAQDPHAIILFISGLAYCARNATDGEIPATKVHALMGYRPKAQRALLNAGLWHKSGPGQGIQVHDWSQWNQKAADRSASARNAAQVRWARARAMRPQSDPHA